MLPARTSPLGLALQQADSCRRCCRYGVSVAFALLCSALLFSTLLCSALTRGSSRRVARCALCAASDTVSVDWKARVALSSENIDFCLLVIVNRRCTRCQPVRHPLHEALISRCPPRSFTFGERFRFSFSLPTLVPTRVRTRPFRVLLCVCNRVHLLGNYFMRLN